MNTNPSPKKMSKKKRNRIIAIATVLILLAAGASGVFYLNKAAAAKKQTTQQTAKVTKGNLSVTITGSGTLISENKTDVTSSINGTVETIRFKEGDSVKNGDLLMTLDDTDAQLNVAKVQSNLDQANVTLNSNLKDLSSLNVFAPISGEVIDVSAKAGDTVGKNGTVLTITDKSKLKLVVPFKNNLRGSLKIGMPTIVTVYDATADELITANGKITYISEISYKDSEGNGIYNVQMSVTNNGSLNDTMTAGADINLPTATISSSTNGKLSYWNSQTVKSLAGGTVSNVNVSVGQVVKRGKLLAELTNSELVITKQTNQLKVLSLQSELTAAKKQLSYCKIKAPISGLLAKMDIKVGSAIKLGDVLSTLTDLDNMQFDVPVDELDIAKITAGQPVSVTVDALPETTTKPLEGTVSKVALEGTTTSGVTTYAVTIRMNESISLKDGMNANGEIIISQRTGVLLVPIEAVMSRGRNSIVWVKGAPATSNRPTTLPPTGQSNGQSSPQITGQPSGQKNFSQSGNASRFNNTQSAYYAGSNPVTVKVGISNAQYIEITEGLKEGDIVVLPAVTASSTTTTGAGARNSGIPMGGGFGGGGDRPAGN